jgi:hypothetical protein
MRSTVRLCVAVVALTAAAGCAGSKPSVKIPPRPVSAIPAEFAEIPMMLSSTSVEPTPFNVEIGAAAGRNEDWVRDPGLVALHLSKAADAPRVRLYRADNQMESPDSSTVTVIMERLPDDATYGIWTQYRLVRAEGGSWRVVGIKQAYKSRRGADTETYRADPTP